MLSSKVLTPEYLFEPTQIVAALAQPGRIIHYTNHHTKDKPSFDFQFMCTLGSAYRCRQLTGKGYRVARSPMPLSRLGIAHFTTIGVEPLDYVAMAARV